MFKRISRIFKSIINSLFGKVEGKIPIAQMESALRDMQENLMRYKEAVASAIAYEKQAQRKYEEEKQRYRSLTEKAKIAAQKSLEVSPKEKKELEQLTKRALTLRRESEERRDMLKKTWDGAKQQSEKARAQFEKSANEVEKRARQLNEARTLEELNRTRRELVDLSGEFDIESASAVFDRGMESITQEREKLEAMDDIALREGTELDKKLDELVTKDQVEEEFQELIAELGGATAEKEKTAKKEKKPEKDVDTALE